MYFLLPWGPGPGAQGPGLGPRAQARAQGGYRLPAPPLRAFGHSRHSGRIIGGYDLSGYCILYYIAYFVILHIILYCVSY